MPQAATAADYARLEKRLVLLAWLNSLFGYKSHRELLADLRQAEEGYDPHGRSHIFHRLAGRGEKLLRVPLADLARYDGNIRRHLAAINRRRPAPIAFRYFQHLALLYTEIFLDWRFNRAGELLRALNGFVYDRNALRPPGEPAEPEFTGADLNKLAYWMATGSGKTLLMHVNYHQFLHYSRNGLDNILLITPNEGLTEQHLAEMAASDIPYERFNPGRSGLGLGPGRGGAVRVIEITKLVREKSGGGASVPVECFEGDNLIFVDEGHKGSGGEAWRGFRDALGETGFTFEYSATFGQAMTAARNDALTAEYGKAIVFDYSYRYFHGDGYGKDFQILNLRGETTEEKTEILLLGNLLSFHEQQRCFAEQAESLRPYNLEEPLWVFVGSSVNAVYTENRRRRSDVLTVARFLHHFLGNKDNWAIDAIERILEGRTGLLDAGGADVFAGRLEYLRRGSMDPEAIYRDVLSTVFRSAAGGALHICDIRGRPGELGLRCGASQEYFGLIYIGDAGAFKRLVQRDGGGIAVEEDVVSGSLFDSINGSDGINILIGAKKFMEGWNSWRVSQMGLLNMGRSEGSEIIQLFGRGVRLRGRNLSLKRSSAMPGEDPQHIKLLETLNIFAIRADYMARFREYLEREGVETSCSVEPPPAARPDGAFLNEGSTKPGFPDGSAAESGMLLAPDKAVRVKVDMAMRVEAMRSSAGGVTALMLQAGRERVISPESLDLVDWEAVYLELMEFQEQKGFVNLVLRPKMLRAVLEQSDPRLYTLIADESVVKPGSFAERAMLQEAVLCVLRQYVEKFYRVMQERDRSHPQPRAMRYP